MLLLFSCSCFALNQTRSCENIPVLVSLAFKVLKKIPLCLAETLPCNIVLVLCGFHFIVLGLLFTRPHCTGVELSGPLFVLNVRLSLPSSPGVRSGGSGSVMLWTDLGSVHAISCRCAPRSSVGTHCCVKRCGLCLHFKHTQQVCIRENTERKKMSGSFKLSEHSQGNFLFLFWSLTEAP